MLDLNNFNLSMKYLVFSLYVHLHAQPPVHFMTSSHQASVIRNFCCVSIWRRGQHFDTLAVSRRAGYRGAVTEKGIGGEREMEMEACIASLSCFWRMAIKNDDGDHARAHAQFIRQDATPTTAPTTMREIEKERDRERKREKEKGIERCMTDSEKEGETVAG